MPEHIFLDTQDIVWIPPEFEMYGERGECQPARSVLGNVRDMTQLWRVGPQAYCVVGDQWFDLHIERRMNEVAANQDSIRTNMYPYLNLWGATFREFFREMSVSWDEIMVLRQTDDEHWDYLRSDLMRDNPEPMPWAAWSRERTTRAQEEIFSGVWNTLSPSPEPAGLTVEQFQEAIRAMDAPVRPSYSTPTTATRRGRGLCIERQERARCSNYCVCRGEDRAAAGAPPRRD